MSERVDIAARAVAEHNAALAHLPWATDPDAALAGMYELGRELIRREGPAVFALPEERWIYFIQGLPRGPIKIGSTHDVKRRVADLQTGHPWKLRILGVCRGDIRLELELHERFAASRLHGEWFSPSRELARTIRKVCR